VSVAVLHAVGEIRRAANPPIGITGGSVLSPETFVRRIRAVAKDRKVKAVVLRVDSPGGSAVASGALWAELNRVREAGKPLVISMGAVAGSGGYYIATPGDRIVAQPGTITGSIGVISLFPVVRELKDRMHVTTDQVYTGAEAPPFSVNRELTPGQRARVDVQIDAIYDAFLQRVAEGRHLAVEQVRGIAGGRVWTGADAVNVGLVDELGGLDRAMALAVELSGAPAGARAVPRKLPRRTLPLRRRASSSDDVGAAAATFSWRAALDVLPRGAVTHMGVDPRTFWLR
jgi:protease-4